MLIKELLIKQKNNNTIALKQGEHIITYADLHLASINIAENILSVLSDTSNNVALFLPNSINYVIAYFGIQYANKTIIPIGTQSKTPELLSTLEYCEIDLIITNSFHAPFIKQALTEYNYKIEILIMDIKEMLLIHSNKSTVRKSEDISHSNNENDVAIMLHTSGTTNNPKRVMLTHCNLISNVKSNITSLELTHRDKVLIALPMFFGYCNTAQLLTHIYLGATIIIMDSMFLPKQFFRTVQNEKITNFTGVPSMLLMLLDYRYSENYDISSLRYICFGGGKMPIEELNKLIMKFPCIGFVQTYGQTECSPRVTALLPEYALSKIGSVGKPIPGITIRIVNENLQECFTEEIGEIMVIGNSIMKGYYKQPRITELTIQNGWLHTGDLGYIDNDGFLYLTGRIKNIIISGGTNIYPEEIEQILLQHYCINDVCVLGEEHDRLGEVPIAKVVLSKRVSKKVLREYCTEKLAQFKIPVRFDFVSTLPKTYNGKTKRY